MDSVERRLRRGFQRLRRRSAARHSARERRPQDRERTRPGYGCARRHGDQRDPHEDDVGPRPPSPQLLRRGVVRNSVDVPVSLAPWPHHEAERRQDALRPEDGGEGPRLLGLVRSPAPVRPDVPPRLRGAEVVLEAPRGDRGPILEAGPPRRRGAGLPRGVPPLSRLARGVVPLCAGNTAAVAPLGRRAGADGLHRLPRPEQQAHGEPARLRGVAAFAPRADRRARAEAPRRDADGRRARDARELALPARTRRRGGAARPSSRRQRGESVGAPGACPDIPRRALRCRSGEGAAEVPQGRAGRERGHVDRACEDTAPLRAQDRLAAELHRRLPS